MKKLTVEDLFKVGRKLPGGRVEYHGLTLVDRGPYITSNSHTATAKATEVEAVKARHLSAEALGLLQRVNDLQDEKETKAAEVQAKRLAYIATLPVSLRALIGKRIVVANFLTVTFNASYGDEPHLECSCGPDGCTIEVEVAEQLVENLSKCTAAHTEYVKP